ncbi:hypothetical protein MEQU1_000583 [Malassezia equina]|uniref:AAA+ ATPase domain-containing protein n=1 Tax=Malassezia equina TaxID=1381935 RepID=A0AAF0IXJ0_9BASI|nr:hypothetical protein MEQU1_000583 [Malassezia equina]
MLLVGSPYSWTTPFGKEDWTPFFRLIVLNTAVPLFVLLVSALAWLWTNVRDKSKRRSKLALEVAHLNPESSHFYNAIPEENPLETSPTVAEQVFQAENVVLIDQALGIKEDLSGRAAAQRREVLQYRKRTLELLLSIAVVIMCIGSMGSQADAGVVWPIYWTYFATISALTLWKTHSMHKHKLVLSCLGTLIALSNLRSALLMADMGSKARMAIVIQTALIVPIFGLSIMTPITQALPSGLRTLQETMHKHTVYSELRTAVPTPPRIQRAVDRNEDAIVPSFSKDSSPLLPPPEQHASLLSRALFLFVQPVIWKHYFEPITLKDVPQLMTSDRAASVTATFRIHNGPEIRRPLWKRLVRHFLPLFTYQSTCGLLATFMTLAPVFFLSRLLNFFTLRSDDQVETPMHLGVFFASGMFVSQILHAICQSQSLITGRHICVQLRALVTFEVLSKTMRRGLAFKKKIDEEQNEDDHTDHAKTPATDGAITNLVSVDVNNISELASYIHFLIPQQPLTVIMGVVYITALLGWSAVVGLVLLVVAIPIQAYLTGIQVTVQANMLCATDERLDLASEVLNCIKTVKFFAWETPFERRMNETRGKELKLLRRHFLYSILIHMSFIATPMLVTMATFGVHTLIFKKELTAEKAFTALALFNTLRGPLADLPSMIHWLLSAIVSVRRIDSFLNEPDTKKYEQLLGVQQQRMDENAPLEKLGFDNATFTHGAGSETVEEEGRFMLRNLNCQFPTGQLSVIVGPVGSGKSSLLHAMMGELHRISGSTFMPCSISRSLVEPDPVTKLTETVAYCSQNAWLLGTTVRQNILFGTEYDDDRYHEVLRACALEPDLDILEFHDETEVGEKGTSLSGGQKARIALARAFYSHAKHILIDDALSAVDAHTAKHLHQHCFLGPLAEGRTIILVTHAAALMLPSASYVVVMDSGRVAAQGSPEKLLSQGKLSKAVLESAPEPQKDEKNMTISEDERKGRRKKADQQRARKALADKNEERLSREHSSWYLYWFYMSSVAKSNYVAALVWMALLILYISIRIADVGSGAWLRNWARSYDNLSAELRSTIHALSLFNTPSTEVHGQDKTWFYMKGYAAIIFLFVFISFVTDLAQYTASLQSSKLLYDRMIRALLQARPQFYDRTPIGRITNRLSRDMQDIDRELIPIVQMAVENLISLVSIVAVICWATPKFLLVLGFIMAIYYLIGSLYLASSRDLKRIESIQRSPLYTLVGETIAGTITIRAYSDGERVMKQCLSLIDKWNRAFLLLWYENRWLSICCDIAGSGVTFIAALFLLFGESDAALAGFTLSYAIMLVDVLLWLVRLYSTVEINMNSVERVGEYISIESEQQGGVEPPAHWPTDTGAIHVQDLSVRYGKQFPLALQNVSFSIHPGEKVGIVGRTGSGKSTLSLAFFRFLEAERGSITIDGIDISTLSLQALRRKLTIIPQDSQLFKGTIRSNLDPFQLTDDADMWFALQRCKLAVPGPDPNTPGEGSVVKSLDDPVDQGGANFSAGQRQLLSLARGLLKMRDSKVLILDESTANLDSESDALIQRTIREQMAPGATILTVAHRLKTIIDYDKVLVLGQGKVIEFDSPSSLISNPSSSFYQLCEQSGEMEALRDIAMKRD